MTRLDPRVLVAALLCVAAIGLAAATIADPVTRETFPRDLGDDRIDTGSPFDFDIDTGPPEAESGGSGHWEFTTACIPFLLTPLFYGLTVVGFLGIFLGMRRFMASEYGFAVVAFLVPIVLFAHATFTSDCHSEPVTLDLDFPTGVAVNDTLQKVTQPVSPQTGTPLLGLLVLGGFLLLVVAALITTVRQRAADVEPSQQAREPSSSHDLSGVARVAGEAADRIEGGEADPGNEVYRAWRAMTDHLAIPDTRTTTPAEFRAAALDAGMSPGHVDTITDLFRDVRYGGGEPTADREERAVAALRAIETAYGGDEQ